MESFRATLQKRMDMFCSRFCVRCYNILMNKQLEKQNLRELAKLTLLNILQTKGLYYQKYQRLYQQKHQSSYHYFLPKKF
jgi:hypothetical protein